MPYQWTRHAEGDDDAPRWRLVLWPHRSLPPQGFAAFIAITCLLLLVPLVSVLGTPVLWALLPFLAGAVALTWYFLRRSYADAALREDLALWPHRIELVRRDPGGGRRSWQADPHWVRVSIHADGGPVENYVTLRGAGREVEIGAFLSPEERAELYLGLSDRLESLSTGR